MPASPPPTPGSGASSFNPDIQDFQFINLRIVDSLTHSFPVAGGIVGASYGIVASNWGSAVAAVEFSFDFEGVDWFTTAYELDANSYFLQNICLRGVSQIRMRVTTGDDTAQGDAKVRLLLVSDDASRTGNTVIRQDPLDPRFPR